MEKTSITSIMADGTIIYEGEERPDTKKQTKRERDGIISDYEFFDTIPDEAAAVEFFERHRWGDTPRCPRCESEDVALTPSERPMRWRCRSCRRYFSVKIGTVMEQSQIPLRKWLRAIYLMHTHRKGINAKELAKQLRLTYKSAWFLAHRIREAMQYPGPLLAGEVEVDESFFGGKSNRKHFVKREEDRRKREAGLQTHRIVIGMKERGGNIVAFPIDNRSVRELNEAIEDVVERGAIVYSDGYAGYQQLRYNEHSHVNHSKRVYVEGSVHTNGIESFWSEAKRAYIGIFHFMSSQHMHRYLRELAHRENVGPGNNFDAIGETVKGMVGRRLTYKELTGHLVGDELPDWLTPAEDGPVYKPVQLWQNGRIVFE